jgi:hypothetical protein
MFVKSLEPFRESMDLAELRLLGFELAYLFAKLLTGIKSLYYGILASPVSLLRMDVLISCCSYSIVGRSYCFLSSLQGIDSNICSFD